MRVAAYVARRDTQFRVGHTIWAATDHGRWRVLACLVDDNVSSRHARIGANAWIASQPHLSRPPRAQRSGKGLWFGPVVLLLVSVIVASVSCEPAWARNVHLDRPQQIRLPGAGVAEEGASCRHGAARAGWSERLARGPSMRRAQLRMWSFQSGRSPQAGSTCVC